MKPKILVILGPTATGKSDLAVKLARKFNGEIVSTDSRQVYKGLDIGTGKITKKEMRGIPHHMLDIVSPKKRFSVAEYKEQAEKIIDEILSRGKLPILVGGTGFYIQAIVDGIVLPDVPANKKLRAKLQKYPLEKLQRALKKLDPKRFAEIDSKNPVRLIRAIEIATALGKVPKTKKQPKHDTLQIGFNLSDSELREKIKMRLISRIKDGMIVEAKRLRKQGLSWKRFEELGLEYRYLGRFLKKFPRASASSPQWSVFQAELERQIWHYARRQKTWFRKDKRIKWFSPSEFEKIYKEIKKFLRS